MIVEKSRAFNKQFLGLITQDQKTVFNFIKYVQEHGLTGLPGRNKKSDNVSDNYAHKEKIEKFAQDHRLWHYHIGIPNYSTTKGIGKYTSDYVIHYQRLSSDKIKLISIDNHRPFRLPKENTFEGRLK